MISKEEIQEYSKQEKNKILYTSSSWKPYYDEDRQSFFSMEPDEWNNFYDMVMRKIEW